jgi:membrane protein DedA with SNARE-associated domain
MFDLSAIIEQGPYLGLFLLLILGGVGFPFPEDATLILCGFLISTHVVKPVYALLVVYAGLLAADFSLYLVGRKYGRMIVCHRRFHKIISPERLLILEDKFNKRGILFILFGRQLIGLRAQIFLAAGVMRMSAIKFLITDAISFQFTIALMVGAGYIGGHNLQVIKKHITRIEHIGILLIIIIFSGYLFLRYFRYRRDRSENVNKSRNIADAKEEKQR